MGRFIKGKDGKFAGSVGDGKDSVPTAAPTRELVEPRLSNETMSGDPEAVRRTWEAFRKAQETAVDAEDYINADLTGQRFENQMFAGTDFTGANLTNTRFVACDLSGVDFTHANLTGTLITGCSLNGATLKHANLTDAKVFETDLANTDFDHADLTRAHLSSCRATYINLNDANLAQAHLTAVNARAMTAARSDWRGAQLHGVNMPDADLSWAMFTPKSAEGVRLSRSNVQNTTLDPRVIKRSMLGGVHMEQAAPVARIPLMARVRQVMSPDRWRQD